MLPTTVSFPSSPAISGKNGSFYASCSDLNGCESVADTASACTATSTSISIRADDHQRERSQPSTWLHQKDDSVVREAFCLSVQMAVHEHQSLLQHVRNYLRRLGDGVMNNKRQESQQNSQSTVLEKTYYDTMSYLHSIEERLAHLEDLEQRASWSRGTFPLHAFQHSLCAVLAGTVKRDEFLAVTPIEI